MVAKWNPAVLAIACRCLAGLRSASVRGIAGHRPLASPGTAGGKVAPRSGFLWRERYRVHQLVSMVSSIRLVRRLSLADPVAVLPGRVLNASRFTGCAPRDFR